MLTSGLIWLFGNGDPIRATSRVAVIGASLVIFAAGILGYTALFDLFNSIGLFHPFLAIFFPLLFDFAEITAAVIVLNAKLQGEDDVLAWRAVLLFTGLGIIANVAHAAHAHYNGLIDQGQAVLAIFATALFPLSVALVTHLLKSVITREITRNEAIKTLNTLLNEIAEKRKTCAQLETQLAQQQEQFVAASQQQQQELETKQAIITQLHQETDELTVNIEHLRKQHVQAQKGDFLAGKAERQAYQLDALLAGGMNLTNACKVVGISPNTARKRLRSLDGNLLSDRRNS